MHYDHYLEDWKTSFWRVHGHAKLRFPAQASNLRALRHWEKPEPFLAFSWNSLPLFLLDDEIWWDLKSIHLDEQKNYCITPLPPTHKNPGYGNVLFSNLGKQISIFDKPHSGPAPLVLIPAQVRSGTFSKGRNMKHLKSAGISQEHRRR